MRVHVLSLPEASGAPVMTAVDPWGPGATRLKVISWNDSVCQAVRQASRVQHPSEPCLPIEDLMGLDRLCGMCGEAGVSPGEELVDGLLGDGMAIEKPGENSLAEEPHQEGGVPLVQAVERAGSSPFSCVEAIGSRKGLGLLMASQATACLRVFVLSSDMSR